MKLDVGWGNEAASTRHALPLGAVQTPRRLYPAPPTRSDQEGARQDCAGSDPAQFGPSEQQGPGDHARTTTKSAHERHERPILTVNRTERCALVSRTRSNRNLAPTRQGYPYPGAPGVPSRGSAGLPLPGNTGGALTWEHRGRVRRMGTSLRGGGRLTSCRGRGTAVTLDPDAR